MVQGNVLNTDPKMKIKGPFRRYMLDFSADPHAIRFTKEEGGYHCSIELVTLIYDRDGGLINSLSATVRGTLPPANYAKAMQTGIQYHQEISVPVKGEYFLRTAIHDLDSDHVGAVEVPIATVARLTPVSATPAGATPPQQK